MRRISALLFAVAIVIASALSTPSALAAAPQWRLQSVPGLSQGNPTFSGVSCPTTTVCVAVGSVEYFDSNGHGHTIQAIERWQGGQWHVQSAPAANQDTALNAVSCASASACLAVGVLRSSTGTPHPLVERYNSGNWTVVLAPSVSTASALESVSCSSSTVCTTVGMAHVDANGNHLTPLIERWSGGTWKQHQAPKATVPAALASVSCASATSCVAVGFQQSFMHALAIRWNGKAWTALSVPAKVQGLLSVSCATATICTALAQRTAVRWAGHGPVTSSIPVPADVSSIRTQNISCPTADVCEVAGGYVNTHGNNLNLAARLSVGHWTLQSPDNSGFDMAFAAISCSTSVTCEAVGGVDGSGLAERYS
jgi:hypothetical protein